MVLGCTMFHKRYSRSIENIMYVAYLLKEGCTIPWCPVIQATKFSMMTPHIYGPSARNLFRVTLLAPRILRLLGFWKIYRLMFEVLVVGRNWIM